MVQQSLSLSWMIIMVVTLFAYISSIINRRKFFSVASFNILNKNRRNPIDSFSLARYSHTPMNSLISSSSTTTTTITFTNAFDRWKFLQQTLDGETSLALEVYPILYSTLCMVYSSNSQDSLLVVNNENEAIGTNVMPSLLGTTLSSSLSNIQSLQILLNHSTTQFIYPSEPSEDDIYETQTYNNVEEVQLLSKIYTLLESLQPDSLLEEDAYKSCWDLVLELHGQEATKFAMKKNDLEWNYIVHTTV